MIHLRTVLFLLLLGAALAPAQNAAVAKSKKPPTLRRGASHAAPANRQAATQLASSFDAGDAYRSTAGQRKLLRLSGALAVSANFDSPEFQQQLTTPGKPLASFTPAGSRSHGITLLNASAVEQRRQLSQPAAFESLLKSVRATTAGRSANPVFIDPDSGLRLVATSELIVCLKPGIDAKQVFGSEQVRLLTSDQFVLTLPGATAEEIFNTVNRYAARAEVEWAEPNFLLQLAKSFIPNDPLFIDQWHLQNTGQFGGKTNADAALPGAWDVSLGNSNVVIAIMDDGVQLNHPDLAPNIFSNPGEIPGNGVDDDNNGFIDDVHGWNFLANDNDPNPAVDLDNHGTALAGVIAGVGNNGVGISGAAPRCQLLPLKMLTGEEGVPITEVSRVLHYAAGLNLLNQPVWRGADIINISLTFAKTAAVDSALTTAATKGRGGKGCAIVCASGNSAGSWVPFEVEFEGADNYTLRWEYTKDFTNAPNLSVGADTVWLDNVVFPNGTVESFEGGGIPNGWTTGGDAPWFNVVNGVGGNRALTGWNGPGSHSLRAGHIADNQSSYVEVNTDLDAGILRFWAWTESEAEDLNGQFTGYDVFHFIVDGLEIDYDFGVPVLETNVAYPANHPVTFAVGASTDFDYRADYSQFGAALDFVAPSDGGNASITTTDRTGTAGYNTNAASPGNYAFDFGGTSSATPLASGIVALVLSTNPYLTLAEIRTLLRTTCDHIGNVFYDETGFNSFYGYGRLNADHAVKLARPNLIITTAVSPNPVVVGDTLTYTLNVRNNGRNISGPLSITNQLPASAAPGLIVPPPFSRAGSQIVFHATNLAAGGLLTYRIVVTNLAAGTNVNLASVGTDIPESTLADNISTNNVTVLPLPLLSITDSTVLETDAGVTNALFTVSLSNSNIHVVTVRYAAASGSATRTRDFAPASGLLRFAPGETTKTITVRVLPDKLDENDEDFFVNLSSPVNASISPGQGVGHILDNDPLPTLSALDVTRAEGNASSAPAVFKVRLSAPSGRPVSVQFTTTPGSALAGIDFISTNGTLLFAPGKTILTVPVRIIGETLPETNETFFLNLSNPVSATLADDQGICTIVNNDPAPRLYISDATVTEGDADPTNALFNVQLRPASGTTVTVHFFTTNGSAGSLDYIGTNGMLSFAPGETNLILAVPAIGDALSESNETFSVRLSAPTNAALGDALGLGTILDNDPLPSLSIRDTEVLQTPAATTNAIFHVELSEISGKTVTVRFATSNGTAVAVADFVARAGVLTFPPGTTTQDVTIVVQRASVNESNELFFVNLSAPVNATLADPQATGTIFKQAPVARSLPAVSSPPILDLRLVNGKMRLRFQTEVGVTYRVEYCADLSDSAAWKPLPGTESVPGTGAAVEISEPIASKRVFYRLRIE